MSFFKILFICLFSLTIVNNTAIALDLKFSDKVPAGFEDLAAPQHTLLDIHYGGRLIGNAFATFSNDSFEFDDPEKVSRMIPHLKKTEEKKVINAFSGKLEQHRELVCQKPRIPKGCDSLLPAIAGIIFNEGYFKVEIFVHPDLLELVRLNMNRYLPWAEEEVGLNSVINLSGNVSGGSEQKLNYNLRYSSVLSHHLIRFRSENTFSSQQGLRMESFIAEKEWQNWLLSMGMFQSTPMRLLGQKDVLGLRFGSSLKMRTDLDTAFANQISLFLPRRSLIKVFRDKRLLLSQVYEQGNQEINTSNFPEGAYDVTILIDDEISEPKTEIRFFAKETDIPPLDTPNYFAEVGLIRKNQSEEKGSYPSYSGKLFAHIGTARRFSESIAADTSLLFANNEYVASLGLFTLQPFLDSQLRLGGVISSTGAYGAEISSFARYKNFSIAFDARKFWNKDKTEINDFSVLPKAFTQANFSSNLYIFNTEFGVKGQWQKNNRQTATSSSYNLSPFIRHTLFQNKEFRIKFESSYTLTEKDNLIFASINIDFNQEIDDGLNIFSQLKGEYRSDQKDEPFEHRAKVGLEWQDDDFFGAEVENKVEFKREEQGFVVHNENEYKGNYANIASFMDYSLPDKNKSQSRYGVNFNVALLGDLQNIVLDGERIQEAAVIIDLQGTPEEAAFDVLVAPLAKNHYQERVITRAFVGKFTVVPLDAYESYSIRLQADKKTFAQYDTKAQQITLYPGHIRYLTWKVSETFIIVGTLEKPDGTLVKNAHIKGAIEPAFVDSQGFFQADVKAGTILIAKPKKGQSCQVKLPNIMKADNGIVTLKKLICIPTVKK